MRSRDLSGEIRWRYNYFDKTCTKARDGRRFSSIVGSRAIAKVIIISPKDTVSSGSFSVRH
jgi:hypothetical protein